MAAHNEGTSDGGLRLESIELEFTTVRPKQTMQVDVAICGTALSCQFSENEQLRFGPNLACILPIYVNVHVRIKKGIMRRLRRKYVSLVQIEEQLAIVDRDVMTLEDEQHIIRIKLVFSGVTSLIQPNSASGSSDQLNTRRTGLDKAIDMLKEKKVLMDKLGKFKFITENLIQAGVAIAEVNPIAKACFAAVEKIYKACEAQEICRDAAIELADRLEIYQRIIKENPDLRKQQLSGRAVDTILVLIKDFSEYVNETANKKGMDWKGEYRERMASFSKQFNEAKEEYDTSISIETLQMLQTVSEGLSNLQVNILGPVFTASELPEVGCLEGTRIEPLAEFLPWFQDIRSIGVKSAKGIYAGMDQKRIVWLCGLAGSGKSTIAKTVITLLESQGHHPSRFFCKRDDADRSSTKKVFPTLSYQLTTLYPAYRDAIAKLLSSADSQKVFSGDLESQVEALFTTPLKSMTGPPLPHVIVVDALDECGDSPDSRGKLVAGLIALVKATPWLKVLITSRDQDEIRNGFGADAGMCHTINIRDVGDVDADIRFYTKYRLEKLKETRKLKGVSVADYTERLVTKAANLFVWISTVFRYLESSLNPSRDIEDLVSGAGTLHEPLEGLYDLYDKVLSSSGSISARDMKVMRCILGIIDVTSSTSPLPAGAIATFLQTDSRFAREDADSVGEHVRALRAVLYEDEKSGGAVRAYHPSFLDFLSTKVELNEWESSSHINKLMFKASLSLMLNTLKFNSCSLEDASVMNKDVVDLDQRISRCIPPELGYSCQHWFTHLQSSELSAAEAQESVSQLLCGDKVLFWLEVLSIVGGAERSTSILQKCCAFFERFENILQASDDVLKFVSSHSQAMASVPHIYISALSWVPAKSYLRDVLRKSFNHHSLVGGRLPANWDRSLWTKHFKNMVLAVSYSPDGRRIAACIGREIHLLDAISGQAIGEPLKGHTNIMTSISFSPDSSRIASGSDDETIRIWNTRTGQQVGEPLRGHSKRVRSVAFSPDGTRIASGSDDQTVRVWDTRTGEAIGKPLRGHNWRVTSVAFSHDGSRIASDSRDGTVRIWDSLTGEPIGDPLEGHGDWVRSIAFAPDGMRIISGSDDCTIRIWDLRTGECVGEPLRGHSNSVCSVAFSPDGSCIISGSSDSTIRMWDSRTGEAFGSPFVGHSASLNSVDFSPDGAQILSGSDDGTVRVWSSGASDASSEPQRGRGHTSVIVSVAFSADGTRIASGSGDKTIRIWDTRTGQQVGEPLRGHSEEVTSVAFSPDGFRIASGSDDETVRIWDSRTGEAIGEPLRGHTWGVTSVAFSHDGSRIASGSSDQTVRIWDSLTGEPIGGPLEGHTGWVLSIAFAPDGMHVISGSDDTTIRFWDLRTSKSIGEPLRGHSDWVCSVAFSPDGTRIASSSADTTIRIWDAGTGESIGNPLEGHSLRVDSVAFSPDGLRIASGSWDNTVRIWDSKTGMALGEPLRCHSNVVSSVSFSPDGNRIASASWDANIFLTTLVDPGRDDWNRMCRNMDVMDGWVKDDDGKLLLWIPERHRLYFRQNIAVWIQDGRFDNVPPVVDLDVLKEFSGTGWTRIYEED